MAGTSLQGAGQALRDAEALPEGAFQIPYSMADLIKAAADSQGLMVQHEQEDRDVATSVEVRGGKNPSQELCKNY